MTALTDYLIHRAMMRATGSSLVKADLADAAIAEVVLQEEDYDPAEDADSELVGSPPEED